MIRGGLVTLQVRDVGLAVRFYVETLGMKLVEESQDVASRAVIDAGEGFHLALVKGTPAHPSGAPTVGLAPKVPLREAVAIYENRGVVFEMADEGALSVARFRDPDENPLYLYQAK